MKARLLLGLLAVLALVGAFGAGSAYATGCYTDFNTAAACWMKNNGIAAAYSNGSYKPGTYLTRGDAATYLYRANRVPPPVGAFHISQSLTGLAANAATPYSFVSTYADAVAMKTSTPGSYSYLFYLTVPTSVYGRATRMHGVKICYEAASPGPTLSSVDVVVVNTSATGTRTEINRVRDATMRTDHACREYLFATPSVMAATHQAQVMFVAGFTDANQALRIHAVTALLLPTTSPAILSGADAAMDGDFAP